MHDRAPLHAIMDACDSGQWGGCVVFGKPEALPPQAEAEVEMEKTRLLYRNVGLGQTATVLGASLLVLVLAGWPPAGWALAWWLAMVALAALRYGLARRFMNTDLDADSVTRWRRRAIVGALLAGVLWGAGGVGFMLAEEYWVRLFAALVMCGMVAGAVPILAALPAVFNVYAVSVVGPVVVFMLVSAEATRDWALAFAATLLLVSLMRSVRLFHASLDNSIRLALRMKEVVAQLRSATDAAEAASQAKSRFLATMSHEIRTPMNGILGNAQLLQEDDLEPADRAQCARSIVECGDSLLSLLNDILDLSRVEAGKMMLANEPFAPAQLLADAEHLFGEAARRAGLQLVVRDTGGSASDWYLGDRLRLRQMLSNLISNAIKFSEEGRIRIEFSETDREGNVASLRFAVSDSGIGIEPGKEKLLFKAFSQLDDSNTREYGGSGLGLSIVANLCEEMGGRCGFERLARGSCFWFVVPCEIAAPAAAEAAPSGAGEVAPTPAPPPKDAAAHHVLVVDDSQTNRMVAEAMLAKLGCRHRAVANGAEAVEAVLGPEPFSLILMDCQMPVMDGFEATRRIREWEAAHGQARVPIVAFTAAAFESDQQHCFEAGMDDVLVKPLKMTRLVQLLDAQGGRQPPRQRNRVSGAGS